MNMSIKTIDTSQNKENKWDIAIHDAEMELNIIRRRYRRLREAVEIFKANKRDGLQWPGDVAEMPKADTSASEG
jgi:uncharacterized protein YqeY